MDQGLAAVWAGVAGLAGAGVGGCFAVWGTVIGGRKAVEAAQEQETRAARAEHQHWQRQQRFESYQALMAAAEPLVTWRDRVPWEEARSGIDPVRTAVHRVQMLGPAAAAQAALQLPRIGAQATRAQWPWAAMTDPCPPHPGVPRDVAGYPDLDWRPYREAFRQAFEAFAEAGREVLGQPPG
jgi:hypothetical protein